MSVSDPRYTSFCLKTYEGAEGSGMWKVRKYGCDAACSIHVCVVDSADKIWFHTQEKC